MKRRITITLSEDLLSRIDTLVAGPGERSGAIERLLRKAVRRIEKRRAHKEEVEQLNRFADRHHQEIMDVLRYQADPLEADE